MSYDPGPQPQAITLPQTHWFRPGGLLPYLLHIAQDVSRKPISILPTTPLSHVSCAPPEVPTRVYLKVNP